MHAMPVFGSWLEWSRGRRRLLGCVVGLVGIVVTLGVTLVAESQTHLDAPAVAFLLPVVCAALFGVLPGLLTTVAAALVIDFFLLEPVGPYPPSTPDDLVLLASFTVLSLVVSMLVSALDRSRRSYSSLIDAAPSAILSTDSAGRITAANPAAQALFRLPHEALVGQVLERVLGDTAALEGRPWRRLEGPAGGVAVQEVHAPLPGGDGHVSILQDVTAEVDLLEHKEAFLLRVAHELRTPVMAQSALLEILAASTRLDGEDQRVAERALAASQRLEALIESVLDLRSVQAGTFQVERMPVPIQQVVGEAAATIEPLLSARGQHLATALSRKSLIVHADRRRLVQVLVNLLSNASRHGPDGDEIAVAAGVTDGQVQVEVRNSRATHESGEQAVQGLGLGLSIARAIVEVHEGRLELDLGATDAVARVILPLGTPP